MLERCGLIGHSITYRIAVGPRAGQKLFTLQLLPARPPEEAGDPSGAMRAGGFSLHAGVAIAPHQRGKLRILASIEEPAVIAKILAHLQGTVPEQFPPPLPLGARAPPLPSSLL